MLFQRPNPFPMSIKDNVVAGVKAHRIAKGKQLDVVCERRLTEVGLWDAVKDRLNDSPFRLSGGQQQLLCLARALAVGPEVLLLDEPTSSLDPVTTESIEALLKTLTPALTLIVVTHNLGQAMRVSHQTMFFYQGALDRARPDGRSLQQAAASRHRAVRHGTDGLARTHPEPDAVAIQCTDTSHINRLTKSNTNQPPHKERTCEDIDARGTTASEECSSRWRPGSRSSSLVLGTAASAAVKLPKSGVETPSGGTVTETGSTLLYPLFNLWASGYNQKFSSTTIQTAGTGSGTGISEAENGTIDIGASDAYLSPSVSQSNPDLKNIPLAISAQLVAYNVPGVTAHLKLSGKVLSEIYQGTDHELERLADRQPQPRA